MDSGVLIQGEYDMNQIEALFKPLSKTIGSCVQNLLDNTSIELVPPTYLFIF